MSPWINLAAALWFASVGACVGSFLNVVAYRLPRGRSVVWQPSRCPACGRAIRAWHNLPVFGWLVLKGQCRDCGAPIAARYPLVEAVVAASFVALAYGELYRGGANLPQGPLSRADDALDLFLRPSWRLIGAFAMHCLMISVLWCLALLHWDRRRAPAQLALAAATAALPLAAFTPAALGVSWRSWSHVGPHVGGQLDALLGSCVAAPPLVAGWLARRRGLSETAWWNTALGVAAIGTTLGLQAGLATLTVVATWEATARWLGGRRGSTMARASWIVGTVTALLLIVAGRQLAEGL